MSIKIVIPSRFGSSRLKGKPLLNICEKPMVLHVVDRCIESGIPMSDIFIATDDQRIINALIDYNVNVVMTSVNHESGTDRINEVATLMNWEDSDIVINVQGDEPMIPPELIQSVANFAIKNKQYHISTAVVPLTTLDDLNNPNVVKAILGSDSRALYFTRAAAPFNRESPLNLRLAKRHIGIYAYQVSALRAFCKYGKDELENYEKLEQLRALSNGMSIGSIIYNHTVPHGVDTLDDFNHIKQLMEDK